MNKQQASMSQGRRRVVLGLAGLAGLAVTGCSLDSSNAPAQSATATSSPTVAAATPTRAAATPTTRPAQGTTLVTYKGHESWVSDVAWSPDSKYIISARNSFDFFNTPAIQVWDAMTGAPAGITPEGISPLAWSPDGKMIVTLTQPDASGFNTMLLWDAQANKRLPSIQTKTANIVQVAWSPGSDLVAAAGYHDVELYRVSTGQQVLAYPATQAVDMNQPSEVVAWSPDGNTIASVAAKAGHSLQFWDAHSGQPLHYFSGIRPTVAVWSPDGKMIASGSARGQAPQVLNATNGLALLTCQATLPLTPAYEQTSVGNEHPYAITWSPDGTSIAVTDLKHVQIWKVSTRQLVYTYSGHSNLVFAVAWSPDGSRIASASYDHTVHVWQAL